MTTVPRPPWSARLPASHHIAAHLNPIEYIRERLASGVAYVILPVDIAKRLLDEHDGGQRP